MNDPPIDEERPEISPWALVHIPVIEPVGWTADAVDAGLRSLDRLRGELEAATALLVAARPDDRDATAALSRLSGVSNREARHRRAVAAVITALPDALEMLRIGALTTEHVAALRPVLDKPGADRLLASGAGMSPEDFAREVQQYRLGLEHGENVAARQHAARSLRFSNGPDGMVRLSGLLPPLPGATLQTMLGAISESNYRRDHPERARILGGHDTDTRDQRLADALLQLAGITPAATVPPAAAAASGSTTTPPSTPSATAAAAKSASADESSNGTANANDPAVTADDEQPAAETATDDGHHDRAWAGGIVKDGRGRPSIRVTTSKPATVIVFNIERFRAEMLNHGPVPVTASLFDHVKRDLYFCFENNAGEVLKYVRGRREPSLLQKIAVWARDLRCQYPGCDATATMSHVHHLNEWLADQGFTDIDVLLLLCHAHHQHLHTNQLIATRQPDGTIAIRIRTTNQRIATATPRTVAA